MEFDAAPWIANFILIIILPTLFSMHGRLSKIEGQLHTQRGEK